jgi:hypothetical protein
MKNFQNNFIKALLLYNSNEQTKRKEDGCLKNWLYFEHLFIIKLNVIYYASKVQILLYPTKRACILPYFFLMNFS